MPSRYLAEDEIERADAVLAHCGEAGKAVGRHAMAIMRGTRVPPPSVIIAEAESLKRQMREDECECDPGAPQYNADCLALHLIRAALFERGWLAILDERPRDVRDGDIRYKLIRLLRDAKELLPQKDGNNV